MVALETLKLLTASPADIGRSLGGFACRSLSRLVLILPVLDVPPKGALQASTVLACVP